LGEKARIQAITPFIRSIKKYLEIGVIQAVDVEEFKRTPQHFQKAWLHDPQYLAFAKAILVMFDHYSNENDSIALICDDDQEKAMPVYQLFHDIKNKDPRAKRRLPSICFGDDREYPSLQAADLISYLVRLEAERKFHGKVNPYSELEAELQIHSEENRLKLTGGFWGKAEFEDLGGRLAKRGERY
jgi:hypothetical protein